MCLAISWPRSPSVGTESSGLRMISSVTSSKMSRARTSASESGASDGVDAAVGCNWSSIICAIARQSSAGEWPTLPQLQMTGAPSARRSMCVGSIAPCVMPRWCMADNVWHNSAITPATWIGSKGPRRLLYSARLNPSTRSMYSPLPATGTAVLTRRTIPSTPAPTSISASRSSLAISAGEVARLITMFCGPVGVLARTTSINMKYQYACQTPRNGA